MRLDVPLQFEGLAVEIQIAREYIIEATLSMSSPAEPVIELIVKISQIMSPRVMKL